MGRAEAWVGSKSDCAENFLATHDAQAFSYLAPNFKILNCAFWHSCWEEEVACAGVFVSGEGGLRPEMLIG